MTDAVPQAPSRVPAWVRPCWLVLILRTSAGLTGELWANDLLERWRTEIIGSSQRKSRNQGPPHRQFSLFDLSSPFHSSEGLVWKPVVLVNECAHSGVTHYFSDPGRNQRLLTLFGYNGNIQAQRKTNYSIAPYSRKKHKLTLLDDNVWEKLRVFATSCLFCFINVIFRFCGRWNTHQVLISLLGFG